VPKKPRFRQVSEVAGLSLRLNQITLGFQVIGGQNIKMSIYLPKNT